MTFDFANYTYSGILAVFAAIFGIGYPLLQQAADGIDAIYDSSRITRLFWKEEKFQIFNTLLRWCLIFSVFVPFVLYHSNGIGFITVTLLAIQAWMTFRLAYHVIMLNRLMQTYKEGSKLLAYLKDKQFNDSLVYLDIAYYAAKKDNYILYHDCLMHIANNFENLNEAKHQELLKKMFDYSSRNDAPEFFKSRSAFFEFLFACFPKDKIDKNLHRLLWRALSENVRRNNHDWIMNYWEHADQFYRFELENEDTVPEDVRRYFLNLHVALGALLVYHGRYEWCDDIGRFTNVEPPHYDLVPSTFCEIWETQLRFSECLEKPNELELMYSLGNHYGIQSENVVYRYIVKYLAFLVIRLKDMNYNVRYADPMDLPLPYTDDKNSIIPQNQKYIRQAELLFQNIQDLSNEKHIDCDDASTLIRSFIERCQAEMDKIDQEREVSKEKEERIKQNLLLEFERQKIYLVLEGLSSLQEHEAKTEQKETCVRTLLNKNDICQGDYRNSMNLEEVIINRLMQTVAQAYRNSIVSQTPLQTYTIRFQDVEKVIRKLQVNDEYAILAYGLNLEPLNPQTTSATIKNLSGRKSEFIILRKSNLPYIQFDVKDAPEPKVLKIINDHTSLFTNLSALQNELNNNRPPILEVCLAYQIIITASPVPYLLFEVCSAITEELFDLNKIDENILQKI